MESANPTQAHPFLIKLMASATSPKRHHANAEPAGGQRLREQVPNFPFPKSVLCRSHRTKAPGGRTAYEAGDPRGLAFEEAPRKCDSSTAP